MRIAFLTLGCKVNSYETEKMKQQFEQAGHMVVSFEEPAEVYVINTCTVTNIADRKSRKMLHRAKRKSPGSIVVAAGCYVDSARKKGEQDASVDLFLSNADKERLVENVIRLWKEKNGTMDLFPERNRAAGSSADLTDQKSAERKEHMSEAAKQEEHTRAYLKVQNGCNQFCTYCIIPYVRGPLTSRPQEEVLTEVRALAEKGIQEVVVTGIHLSSYGVDFGEAKNFMELEGKPLLRLLKAISQVEGIERIRLGSLEPRIITGSFAKALAEIPEVCPHFHLSLQSGCDETLRRMNRRYTSAEYLEKVKLLREVFSHPAITTDIIVGFPQETEEEFRTTCAFARQAAFAQIHVFKYSRRQGTMADAMAGQILEKVKGERSDVLLAVENELEQEYQKLFLGCEEEVLLEEITEIGDKKYLIGYNERYVRIAVDAGEYPDAMQRCNTIATVRVLGHLTEGILLGEFR